MEVINSAAFSRKALLSSEGLDGPMGLIALSGSQIPSKVVYFYYTSSSLKETSRKVLSPDTYIFVGSLTL
jgi:hypothetical protein